MNMSVCFIQFELISREICSSPTVSLVSQA